MAQGWVLDRLLRAGGIDTLWPDVTGTLLEMGFNLSDIQRTMGRVRNMASMPKKWHQTGLIHLDRAEQERRRGHLLTASETYHRAVGCFARARWGMANDEAKVAVYQQLNDAYDQVIALGTEVGALAIQRVDLDCCGGQIPALLHRPTSAATEPGPAVVLLPGMDMIKEYFPVPHRNILAERGVATLTLDPPGHGFASMRGIDLTATNVEESVRAAVDYLRGRTDVDPQRIGVLGIGTGGYFAISAAATDDRIQAVAGLEGGFFYDNVSMLDREPPSRRARLAQMTGLNGASLDALMDEVTIAGREKDVRCPTLLLTGEWDELTPPDQVHRLVNALVCPHEVRIYEDEGHVLGGVIAEAMRYAVDWLVDRFNGRPLDAAALTEVPAV